MNKTYCGLPSRELLCVIGVCALACSPAERTDIDGIEGFGDEAPSEDSTAAGGSSAAEPSFVDPEPLAFGVVAGDRTVVSITLLQPDGDMLAQDFINSGSASTGLVTALSGDVVLPTRSGDPGVLTILDRFRTDVITRIDPRTAEVLGQLKTHAPNESDDASSFSSNPQDYVHISDDEAWITRFGVNASADADDPDRGVDLLRIDPTNFERGERISLWHLNGEAERQNPDTMETEMVTVYAKPSSIVRLTDRLVVGIASLSLTFDAAGKGMVALVDLKTQSAEGFELPELQNCGTVVPVVDDATRVIVACSGFFRGVPRDTAGLAILHLENGALEIEHVWRGKDDVDAPLSVSSVVSLGGSEVVAVATGSFGSTDDAGNEIEPATNDTMYVVDVATGEQTELFQASGQFKIGSGAFNPRKGLLLVPDASVNAEGLPTAGVRTFRRMENGSLARGDTIKTDEVLPPRLVRPL